MGKIKKIKESELIGGTQDTDIYPVTSTRAVFNSDSKNLDELLFKWGESVDRPDLPSMGQQYFDTTLNKPIWFDGRLWVDSSGTEV